MYLASALPKSSFGKQIDVLSLRIPWNEDSWDTLGSHIAVAFAFAKCERKLIFELMFGVLLMNHVHICPCIQTDAITWKCGINSGSRSSRRFDITSSFSAGLATLRVGSFAFAFAFTFVTATFAFTFSTGSLAFAFRRGFPLLAFSVLIPAGIMVGILTPTRCRAILAAMICLAASDAPFI